MCQNDTGQDCPKCTFCLTCAKKWYGDLEVQVLTRFRSGIWQCSPSHHYKWQTVSTEPFPVHLQCVMCSCMFPYSFRVVSVYLPYSSAPLRLQTIASARQRSTRIACSPLVPKKRFAFSLAWFGAIFPYACGGFAFHWCGPAGHASVQKNTYFIRCVATTSLFFRSSHWGWQFPYSFA